MGLLELARPRQWTKNVLVLAAPLAAGALWDAQVAGWTAIAFVTFCLASSSVYMVNDVIDAAADREHATKRNRPVAAGRVSPKVAVVAAATLAVISVAVPAALGNWRLSVVIVGYLVLQAFYVSWLKNEPIFDIACIAVGMLLRAIAGGVASNLPISNAFLIVVGFGALFLAAGKRYSEKQSHDQSITATRKVLASYSAGYLRVLLSIAATVALVGYILWAFEIGDHPTASIPFAQLSIIPFTLAIMRYARDADAADVEAPETAIFADKALLVLGVLWLLLFVGQVLQR